MREEFETCQVFKRDDGHSDEVDADNGPDSFRGLWLLVRLPSSAAVNSANIYLGTLFCYATQNITDE